MPVRCAPSCVPFELHEHSHSNNDDYNHDNRHQDPGRTPNPGWQLAERTPACSATGDPARMGRGRYPAPDPGRQRLRNQCTARSGYLIIQESKDGMPFQPKRVMACAQMEFGQLSEVDAGRSVVPGAVFTADISLRQATCKQFFRQSDCALRPVFVHLARRPDRNAVPATD